MRDPSCRRLYHLGPGITLYGKVLTTNIQQFVGSLAEMIQLAFGNDDLSPRCIDK
jgi:hypothetical protein